MPDQAKHVFKIDLYQSHMARSLTETFEIEATNIKEAENRAEAIAKDKGLTQDYDFEYTDLTSIAEADTAGESTTEQAGAEETAPTE